MGFIISIVVVIIAMSGYFYSIKQSPLEKEIRNKNIDYECFKCGFKFSVNEIKCPECSFVTIYGSRKKKIWSIVPISLGCLFILTYFVKMF